MKCWAGSRTSWSLVLRFTCPGFSMKYLIVPGFNCPRVHLSWDFIDNIYPTSTYAMILSIPLQLMLSLYPGMLIIVLEDIFQVLVLVLVLGGQVLALVLVLVV